MNTTVDFDLRAAYKLLPPISGNDPWARHRRALHYHVENEPLEDFTRWSTIQATMFVEEAPYIQDEFHQLMAVDLIRWGRVLTETEVGNPRRLSYAPFTSGNRAHQCYHLWMMERLSGIKIHQVDTVVEYGGGYGALCSIARNLRFFGDYYIYDFPELLYLQHYYLSRQRITFYPISVEGFLPLITPIPCDFFFALYSLSETPTEVAAQVLDSLKAEYVLIATQDMYGDDPDLIATFRRILPYRYAWQYFPNPNLDGHWYIYGSPNHS